MRLEPENRDLDAPRPQGLDLDLLAATPPDAAARIEVWVSQASEEDMDSILRALDIQVAASKEEVRIEGSVSAVVPQEVDLVTIAQTSA